MYMKFPKITPIEKSDWIGKPEYSMFRLDWSEIDEQSEKDYYDWRNKWWPESNHEYIPTMPKKYDDKLKSLQFDMSYAYRKEIERDFKLAEKEINHVMNLPFDTIVRDRCAGIYAKYIDVAFYLIFDCVWHKRGKADYDLYFDMTRMYKCVGLYKLWYDQTGFGILIERSGIAKLKHWAEDVFPTDEYDPRYDKFRIFFNDMYEHTISNDRLLKEIRKTKFNDE